MKRATAVQADEEDDDTDESDLEDSGSGPVSALTGIFKNVRSLPDDVTVNFTHGCKNV